MTRPLLLALLLGLPLSATADGLTNAYFLCDVFASTGVSTECRASNATSTVDVVISTSAAEAQNVCAVIVKNMAARGRAFGGAWQLRIFAPDRAQEPLAACRLQ
jgi:hypothetical protein